MYQEVEKDVNKVVDEDNVVDKKLNEGTQLEDLVMMNVFIRFLLETAYKLKDTLEWVLTYADVMQKSSRNGRVHMVITHRR